MYTCEKNGKTFKAKGKKAAEIYKAAGYTVTEEPTEETATVKKAAKSKAKAAEATD